MSDAPPLRQLPDFPGGMQANFSKGTHPIWVKVKGQGGAAQFRISVSGCGKVTNDIRAIPMYPGDWQVGHGKWGEGPPAYDLPDVVDGQLFGEWIHLRVAHGGQAWLPHVRLRVLPTHLVAASESPYPVTLAPGQRTVLYAPLRLHEHNVSGVAGDGCPLVVPVAIDTGNSVSEVVRLELRCRRGDESFLFTFLDADGSPQPAAARAPTRACAAAARRGGGADPAPDSGSAVGEAGGECGVLVSMHGMDVTAQRQADAYRAKRRLWVLAPHGRATHSFFWQGPGLWNAEAALAALRRYSRGWREGRFAAGATRIVTGHSNGGYGALLLAALHPAYTLGLAPLAGMPVLGDGGRSGQWASPGADPVLEGLLGGTAAQYRGDLLAGNLRGIPLLARTGADDEVISPHLSRRVTRIACLAGGRSNASECGLEEVRGKGHWWWDTRSPSDGGVLDDAHMRRFWQRALVAPPPPRPRGGGAQGQEPAAAAGAPRRRWRREEEVRLVCWEAAACGVVAGLQATQLRAVGRSAEIRVAAAGPRVSVATRNVRRMRIADPDLLWLDAPPRVNMTLAIDGSVFELVPPPNRTGGGHRRVGGEGGREWEWMCREEPRCAAADAREQGSCSDEGVWRACAAACTARAHHRQDGAGGGGECSSEGAGCCAMGEWERTSESGAGPLRRVLARPVVCVLGTAGTAAQQQLHLEAAQALAARWFDSGGGVVQILSDSDLLHWQRRFAEGGGGRDPGEVNLVLLGGPDVNLASAALAPQIPVQWLPPPAPPVSTLPPDDAPAIRVGPCVLSPAGRHGVVSLAPWGRGGVMVVVAGQGTAGWYKASEALWDGLFEVNHWQHRLPDFLVAGPLYGRAGLGGVVAAGHWGNQWEWAEHASFSACH